jgi:hypothetical protein
MTKKRRGQRGQIDVARWASLVDTVINASLVDTVINTSLVDTVIKQVSSTAANSLTERYKNGRLPG